MIKALALLAVLSQANEAEQYWGCGTSCWGTSYGVSSWSTYSIGVGCTTCNWGMNNGCFGTGCGGCGVGGCGNYWNTCGSSCYGWGNYGPLYGTVGTFTGWAYPGVNGWSGYNGAFYALTPVGGYGACPYGYVSYSTSCGIGYNTSFYTSYSVLCGTYSYGQCGTMGVYAVPVTAPAPPTVQA